MLVTDKFNTLIDLSLCVLFCTKFIVLVCLKKDWRTFHIYECKDKNSFLKSNFFCVKNPKSPFFSGEKQFLRLI